MKRPYFFGYLFVKARRQLALLVMAMGIAFCVLEYSHATTSASATAYQPSTALHRALGSLTDAFSATQRILNEFATDRQLSIPQVQTPKFPPVIQSNADFAVVDGTLTKIDQDEQLLKQSILTRFEKLVRGIEDKLRAYAAGVGGVQTQRAQPAGPGPDVSTRPLAFAPQFDGSVFSPKLGSDVNKRTADLNAQKEFLKSLEAKAENPENRADLTEALVQLDSLGKLLPEKLEPSAQSESGSAGSTGQQTGQAPKVLPSQQAAAQLAQLRTDIRQIFLTSWTLDETFDQAADLAAVEREKCRVATLAERGIWLSTSSRILVALLVTAMISFVILVCADLVKTFLDTASHTGVVADAINAMRGATIIAKSQLREPWAGSGHEIN